MRRFALLTIALAACGLDVVGIDPLTGDGGAAVPADDASAIVEAGSDAPYVPTIDAGAAEVVIANVDHLQTIAMVGTKLVIGRSPDDALVVEPGGAASMTVPETDHATAMIGSATEVYFVSVVAPGSGQGGHHPVGGAGAGTRHPNEPEGIDVAIGGNKFFGAYSNRVVAYDLPGLTGGQNRSDLDGTPTGIAANGSDVFWSDAARGTIFKDSVLIHATPTKLATSLDQATSLALYGAYLFVATNKQVLRLTVITEPAVFADNLVRPESLTVDPFTGNVYWIDRTLGLVQRLLSTTTVLPGAVTTVGTCQPFDHAWPKLITFDGTYVYWGSPNEGTVFRRKKTL